MQWKSKEGEPRPARTESEPEEARSMRLVRTVLRHRRVVIALFSLFTVLCLFCIPHVKVNYNLASYLPPETNSSEALEIMDEAYGTEIPNARLYAEGVSLPQATRLADELRGIDGVDDVMWLGDQVDVLQPIEVLDEKTVGAWKSDGGYLYQLTIDGDVAAEALDSARATASEAGAAKVSLSGDAVVTVDAQESTASEIVYIMLLAVIIIIVIVSLTSESWFEWVIFLLVLAMAIIMNMGTNIFRGEISFITQICAAVLQLAVSMDYAIVMLHTFRRYQGAYPDDPMEAMAHAMHKGFSVVLSSAAVTFFGFLSLSVMSFLIGVDMGIVLAKGIFFSFFSVMFLMPCVLLACLKPLKRFEHKPLLPSFDRFGMWCTRLMIPLSIVVAILAVPAVLGQGRTAFTYGSAGFAEEGSQIEQEADAINEAFDAADTWVMLVPQGQWAHERALVDDLEALPKVDSVISYATVLGEQVPTEMVPEAQRSQLLSQGYTRIVIQTTLDSTQGADYAMVETVRDLGTHYYGDDSYLAGTQVSEFDLKTTTANDSMKVKLFSIGTIALVLLLMFKSLSIPLIMLLPIEVSIWINLAVPYFTGQSINYIGYLVIDAVQLGAAVDYSIIYTREYLEQRKSHSARDAARIAISNSAITIMTSALILTIAGFAIYFIASNGIISEIGMLVGRGAFIAMLMMFTVLPLLFVIGDWVVRHTTIGLKFYSGKESGKETEAHMDTRANSATKASMGGAGNAKNADGSTKAAITQKKGRADAAASRKEGGASSIGKSLMALVCSVVLVSGGLLPHTAYAEGQAAGQAGSQHAASVATQAQAAAKGKEEVVYAKLSQEGAVEGIYVVNGFDRSEGERVTDPGTYVSVTNLSTDEALDNVNGSTTFTSPAGSFYYEGELDAQAALPWDMQLTYRLDGKKVAPAALSGASGKLEIDLVIKPTGADETFSDNYLLQASASFPNASTSDLSVEGGSVAVAGSSQQVTFMVIPGNEGNFHLEANVDGFSFAGFTIVGIPISFALDTEGLTSGAMEDNLVELQDAIRSIDSGASDLESASLQVASGINVLAAEGPTLVNGAAEIGQGFARVDAAAGELAAGSATFNNALAAQSAGAQAQAEGYQVLAAEQQHAYAASMEQAQYGLYGASASLEQAYIALGNGDDAVLLAALDGLSGSLGATGASLGGVATAIGTQDSAGLVSYQAQAAAYGAVGQACSEIASAYAPLGAGIDALAGSTPILAEKYALIENGLASYASGASSLSTGYAAFQEGVSSLKAGTGEFRDRTVNLNDEVMATIEDELKQRLDPDFELHSFVDPGNTDVHRVQFIFMTQSIEEPEEAPIVEAEAEDATFWTRLRDLF